MPYDTRKSASSALALADLLRRNGSGLLEQYPRLKAVALELFADEFTPFARPQTLDAESAWNNHGMCEYLERVEYVVRRLERISLRSLGALVESPCDVVVAPDGLWSRPF